MSTPKKTKVAAPKKAKVAAPKKAAPKKTTKVAPKKVAAPKKTTKVAPKKVAAPKKTTKVTPKTKVASRPAAPRNDAEATRLRELADRHYRGAGVPEDFLRAVALYTEAAELGDQRAISNLMFFYEKGAGARWTKTIELSQPFAMDLRAALHWAKKGAALGMDHARAIARLTEALATEAPSAPTPPRDTPAGQRAAVESAIVRARLDAHSAAILGALAPSIRLVPNGAAARIGGSRLGGLPDLPSDVAWPRGAKGPLSFIAQLDLAEVAAVAPPGALPGASLLAFFYDLAAMPWADRPGLPSAIAVVHVPAGAPLTPRAKPDDLVAPHKYAHVVLNAQPVDCRVELTLPFQRTKELRALGLSDDEQRRYMDHVIPAVRGASANTDAFHRVLGHADPNQGDMTRRLAYQLAGKADALDDAPEPELEADAATFRLLLQIDTDEALRSHWGSGRLFYWIRQADLAAGRFERAVFEFQG